MKGPHRDRITNVCVCQSVCLCSGEEVTNMFPQLRLDLEKKSTLTAKALHLYIFFNTQ